MMGRTILLSMEHFHHLSVEGNRARVQLGARLKDIAAEFKKKRITVPHGECPLVAIGGHCQTGGYGHLLRSYGLAIDYVHSFSIVLANGKLVVVNRPKGKLEWNIGREKIPENDNIFWGVLGGGPNSFGILTEVTFAGIKDKEHKRPFELKARAVYNKDAFHMILKEVQKWSNHIAKGHNDVIPDDLDMMATAVSIQHYTNSPVDFILRPVLRYAGYGGGLLLEMVYRNAKGDSESQEKVDKARALVSKISSEVKGATQEYQEEIKAKEDTRLSCTPDSFVRQVGTTLDGCEFKFPYEKLLNAAKHALSDGFVEDFVSRMNKSLQDGNVRIVLQKGIGGGKMLPDRQLRRRIRKVFMFRVLQILFNERQFKNPRRGNT